MVAENLQILVVRGGATIVFLGICKHTEIYNNLPSDNISQL